MKPLLLSIILLLALSSFSQPEISKKERDYPKITLSYNPIFFLKDYPIDVNNNVDKKSFTGSYLETTFDPSVNAESGNDFVNFSGGHEFKLGIMPAKWIEVGIGYSFYDSYTLFDLKGIAEATYTVSDGGSITSSKNIRFYYGPKFNSLQGYAKFSLPLIKKENGNSFKKYSLNLNPQYGIALNQATKESSTYGIEYPDFPETYDVVIYSPGVYSDPPVEWKYFAEQKPSKDITTSIANLLSLGISFNCLKYVSIYVDFCYYASFNSKNLYIDHYFFQQGSATGTRIRFPGTITTMPTIKTGLSILLPLSGKNGR